jgi:hypothetical protein
MIEPTHLYLDIGRCIYCGATGSSLTREHVLPRGLGGSWSPEQFKNALVLQSASCEDCRQITQAIERECLRSMLGPARARLGLNRKRKTTRTSRASIQSLDGKEFAQEVDDNHVLGAAIIPSFFEAAELSGRPTRNPPTCEYKILIVAPVSKANLEGNRSVGVEGRADTTLFARMLAKIALGVAVAAHGPDGFRPLICDLILGRNEESDRWVGGFAGWQDVLTSPSDLHWVRQRDHETSNGIYTIVEVCLFAEFGGPTNYVVVGLRD